MPESQNFGKILKKFREFSFSLLEQNAKPQVDGLELLCKPFSQPENGA